MYIPKCFEVTDQKEIFSFIQANGFGQLISTLQNRPFSTHLPFLLNESNDKLIGHIAKSNPQHLELDDQEVLVTLQGPHGYISPSWYSTPGVPTWNYQALHLYGKCKVFHDAEKLVGVVNALTREYESTFEQPWEPNYKPAKLSAVVGLEIDIEEIECKFKLNQNRSSQDRNQVVSELEKLGSWELAKAIKNVNNG